MNQLIIELLASYKNLHRISVKYGGISTLFRDLHTVPKTRSSIFVKEDSSWSNQTCSRRDQTSSLFSTGHLTNRRTLNEADKSLLNESLTSLLHKLSFKNETRSFSTLLTGTVLNGSTFNKYVPQRFRHRNVKTGDTSKEKGEEIDPEEESDGTDEEEDDDDGDLSHLTFPEDAGFPNNYRELKVHLKSLRLDAVVSAGLNTARSKVDDYFLESKLKLNGERVLKKSKQMKIGDFVDLIMSVADGKTRVKRVRVLKVDENRTSKDRVKVTIRAWRTAVPVDNTGG